jgi:hypothetical protein
MQRRLHRKTTKMEERVDSLNVYLHSKVDRKSKNVEKNVIVQKKAFAEEKVRMYKEANNYLSEVITTLTEQGGMQ